MLNTIMLANKYKLIEKLKEGSFGIIFKGENVRTSELVAIKFEPKDIDKKTLKNEAKIYQYFGRLDGFPQLKWFGTNENNNYLVIDLLGISLTEMIQYYKAFCLRTVLLLGVQIIKRIQICQNSIATRSFSSPTLPILSNSRIQTSQMGSQHRPRN